MGFEFMLGGMVFSLLFIVKILAIVGLIFLAYWVFKPLSENKDVEFPTIATKKETKRVFVNRAIVFLIAVFLTTLLLVSGGNSRLVIDTPVNRDLIEYQHNDVDLEIKTPDPRTEKLEGFSPLKKD